MKNYQVTSQNLLPNVQVEFIEIPDIMEITSSNHSGKKRKTVTEDNREIKNQEVGLTKQNKKIKTKKHPKRVIYEISGKFNF